MLTKSRSKFRILFIGITRILGYRLLNTVVPSCGFLQYNKEKIADSAQWFVPRAFSLKVEREKLWWTEEEARVAKETGLLHFVIVLMQVNDRKRFR